MVNEITLPDEVRQRAFDAADDMMMVGERYDSRPVVVAAEVAYAAGLVAGQKDERSRIVMWLRSSPWVFSRLIRSIATRIDRGEHRSSVAS